uniref:Uncharacterized protein n=1 Tax=Phenylobacterium glaciei TaxID=2803784 RepID=A0A974S7F2_9CAUL|nr:hypothetical protein JKL49_17990 [Phenylobacterium glaciei]
MTIFLDYSAQSISFPILPRLAQELLGATPRAPRAGRASWRWPGPSRSSWPHRSWGC